MMKSKIKTVSRSMGSFSKEISSQVSTWLAIKSFFMYIFNLFTSGHSECPRSGVISSARDSTALFRAVSIASCAIACVCHFELITVDYMKYETIAFYGPYLQMNQQMPLVSLCFSPTAQDETNVTFMNQRLPEEMVINETVKSVNASVVVTNCRIRNFSTGRMNEDDCWNVFTVTRSTRMHHYSCYTLQPRDKSTFSTLEIASAMTHKNILYGFSLTDDLVAFNRMVFFSHLTPWPDDELLHLIDIDTSGNRKSASYLLVYELLEFKRLRSPYDTHCVHQHPHECSSNTIHDRVDCSRELCHQQLAITGIFERAIRTSGIYLEISSLSAPNEFIKYSAKTDGASFLIQLCSILGLWCSLSVLSVERNCYNAYKKFRKAPTFAPMSRLSAELMSVSRMACIDIKSLRLAVNDRLRRPRVESQKLRSRSLFKVSCKVITVILFAREFSKISMDYFEYRTRMEIIIDEDAPLPLPGLSYCAKYFGWFNVTSPSYQYEEYDDQMTRYENQLNGTVRQIFDTVLDENFAAVKCRHRVSLASPLVTSDNCTAYFNVSKFYHTGFICYFFEQRSDYQFNINVKQYEGSHASVLYSLILNKELAIIDISQPIISIGLPRLSRFLANEFYKERETELIMATFSMYSNVKLPSPYDTRCQNLYKIDECIIKCMNLYRFGLAPYSQLIKDALDVRLVSYDDLKNETLARLIKESEDKCSKVCRVSCRYELTKTILLPGYTSNEALEIAVVSPKYPLHSTNAIPVYTFRIFVYQLACCASFWLGFSAILFFSLFDRRRDNEAISHFMYFIELVNELTHVLEKKYSFIAARHEARRSSGKVRRLLVLGVLSVCFCVHCFVTGAHYFEYPTFMDTRSEFESDFKDLRATLCVTLEQLDLQGNRSLSNIFAKSPAEEDIILECSHRGFNLSTLSHLPSILRQRTLAYIKSKSLCASLFQVKKYISLAMLCYEVTPRPGTYECEFEGKYHLNDAKSYQYFTLSQRLARYDLEITVSQRSATVSLTLGANCPSTDASENNWSWISYIKYRLSALPYPYQTGVFDAALRMKCERQCVNSETIGRMKLLSSYGEADGSSPLNYESLAESVSQTAISIKRMCESKCSTLPMHQLELTYFKTSHEGPYVETEDFYKAENGTKGLWFRNTDYLVPHTHIHPAIRLVDLVLYIGTIYSIWFGLSALRTVDCFFNTHPSLLLDSDDTATASITRLRSHAKMLKRRCESRKIQQLSISSLGSRYS